MPARLLAAMAAALACATGAQAQIEPTAVGPAPVAPAVTTLAPVAPPHVAAGTYVLIEMAEPISTKTIKQGDTFAIRLAAPVMLGGQTILPVGVTGVGQVVDVGRPGFGGKPAKLVLAARRLTFNGQTIALRAMQLGATGADNSGEALAISFIPYVGLASLFIQGDEIDLPVGVRARAKLAADLFPVGTAPANPSPVPALASATPPPTSQGTTP